MVKIVIVGVEGSVNLGFILRLAMNFDVEDIVLVNPQQIDWDEVKRFSAKAHPLIERLSIKNSFNEAFSPDELKVCTSAIISEEDFLRQSITMDEYRRLLIEREGRVALVFGRESTGLTREELKQCDVVLTIPTSSKYPALNLSHAVAILLYETYVTLGKAYREPGRRPVLASSQDVQGIKDDISKLVSCIAMDEKKRERLTRSIINIISRGNPRKAEARALSFVLKRILRRMNCY
ncbi:MAG: RNA methyltransferase [Fervidicoccaceae archaeon]|nr:RNA methyltransferase [Fervidicoccaceae archaeon]